MNIFFAGTPNSAAEILKSLASNSLFNIKGVITQPDKKGKRGNQRIESPVSIMANSLKIQTYKPNNLTKETLDNLYNFLENYNGENFNIIEARLENKIVLDE